MKKCVTQLSLCLVLSLLLPVLFFGCGSNQAVSTPTKTDKSSAPVYGGILIFADQWEGSSIGFPAKLAGAQSNRKAFPVIETLFRFDSTGKIIPWLATGYVNDVSAKTLTLTLRKGVKFHDDTVFNADAVKWNLEQYMAAKTSGTENFKSIEIIDDYNVRIILKDWDSTVVDNLAQTIGMMISPAAFKTNGAEWCAKNPVGTGPFKFVSWTVDVNTVYKKYENYWQTGKPYLDGIELKVIANSITRDMSLRSGEINLALSMALKDLKTLEKDGFIVTRVKQGSGASILVPSAANPKSPWADIKVRQATQYAIDNESLVKAIFYGEAEATNQYGYKAHWAYNPNVTGYPYNVAKAKQLLSEAGYANGFATKISYSSNPERDLTYQIVQEFLKQVGINVTLEPLLTAAMIKLTQQAGTWDGLVQGNVSTSPDVVAGLSRMYSGGGNYFSQMLVPDDYVKAIRNSVTAADFPTKQKYVQEAMKLMIDQYCITLPLFSGIDSAVSYKYVHNHGLMGTPYVSQWTPEEAWIDKK